MDENLHRLVYYSRNRLGEDASALVGAIDYILATSQRNNAGGGITGALMFDAGCFGQVLEGSREALVSTFDRIQRDKRHGDVTLLAFEPIAIRIFGQWSMRFVGIHPAQAEPVATATPGSEFDPSQVTGDTLLALLQAMAVNRLSTTD